MLIAIVAAAAIAFGIVMAIRPDDRATPGPSRGSAGSGVEVGAASGPSRGSAGTGVEVGVPSGPAHRGIEAGSGRGERVEPTGSARAPDDGAATEVGSARAPDEAAKPRRRTGLLSIDSAPYATIYVDGSSLGVTPIVKRALSAGRHKVRAVLANGRAKTFSIEIVAGKQAPAIKLTDW